jgi:Protein of unknown function (DUF3631)
VLLKCRAGCEQDALLDALRERRLWPDITNGVDHRPAAVNGSRRIVAIYEYRDEAGALLFQVVRFVPKDFRQRRPDGNGGWNWNLENVRRVPYRLPELIATPLDQIVYIAEGEKDVEALAAWGRAATCNPGGAGKWRDEFAQFFRGRDVVVLGDNDLAGREHALRVASNLASVAARVAILELPDLPPKGDVSDWLDAGGTKERLDELADAAPLFRPGGATPPNNSDAGDDKAEIARLAHLSPLQYDREREAAAERLGCRMATLDDAVRAARGSSADPGDAAGRGRRIEIADFERWPDPVSGRALLEALARTIRENVILSLHQADAVGLWTVYTHAFDAFDFSPKLVIRSPEKRSGKTRLVEVLERLARRPLFVSGISAAALLRVIEQHAPAMLLDEIDTLMKGDAEMAEALRGMINSGFTRTGARFVKNVPTPDGGFEPRAFSTWCPMLLAGIGKLPDTIADRSITIEMKRKRPDEKVKRLRARDGGELWDLGRKVARWATDNLDSVGLADPEVPEKLNDRAADAWSPLLAIADVAGGDWPARARKAAIELSGGEGAETMREILLNDIWDAFHARNADRLPSDDLVDYLIGLEHRPWSEINRGKPVTKAGLARLLKPFKVVPGTIRLDGGRTAKGYYRRAFDDAFERYVPCAAFQNVTTSQARKSAALSENQNVTNGNGVTLRNRESANASAGCDVVTDQNPVPWRARL